MKTKSRNKHRGSRFEDFMAEEGLLAETKATAIKRVLAWKLGQAMKRQRVNKSRLAKAIGTSRAAVDRLLDPENPSVTLKSIVKAAEALEADIEITVTTA